MADPVRVGIIGYGFMGHTHAGAYAWADIHGEPVEVVCIADSRGEAALDAHKGNLVQGHDGPRHENAHFVTDHRALLEDQSIDLVSVCTPTDTHVDLAIEALDAGKHVLVEKPVAVRSSDAVRLLAVANETDRLCMPAMCMRFWPGWTTLAEMIHTESLGRTLAASFTRTGAPPAWSSFYADDSKSGGALLDLHIHDVDFILRCFGLPDAVSSVGSASHVSTQYKFQNGPGLVVAEGGWLRSSHMPFTMRFAVEFERGVITFDLGNEPSLTVHDEAEGTTTIDVSGSTGYDHQAAALIRAIRDCHDAPVTVAEAVRGLEIVEAERASLDRGEPVPLPQNSSA